MLTAHCSLLTAHCSLLTAHCSLLTAHCSLLTAHCSLTAQALCVCVWQVLHALHRLHAQPHNIVLLEDGAHVPPPRCPPHAGPAYDRPSSADGGGTRPTPGSAGSDVRGSKVHKAVCAAYGLPCSQHVVDGMLVTRASLYALVLRHEQRASSTFDHLLFVRPDLVALVPSLPWCMLPLLTPRKNQDWLESMPRHLAAGALDTPHHEYYACRTPNFTLFGRDYTMHAAYYGTHLVQDDSLRLVAIARDQQAALPHKKDCSELALGFQAALPAGALADVRTHGLGARLVAQASPALRHCARCLLDACASLTFANPRNRVQGV
jgi:hypothetical protein